MDAFNGLYVTLSYDGKPHSHHRVDLSFNKLGAIPMDTRQCIEMCLLSGQLCHSMQLVEPLTLKADGIEVAGGT